MAQSLNLSVSGRYTSISDFNGLPPGALEVAMNVESRYKNVLEPRRGFESLESSNVLGVHFIRLINFKIGGVDSTVGLTDSGELQYYDGSNPWPSLPGDFSSNVLPPDPLLAKSRFVKANQNLYITSRDGLRSLSSGTAAETLRAGVPKALNIEAKTNTDAQGFFDNNVVLSTTGNLSSGGADILNLLDTTGVIEGQFIGDTAGNIPVGTKISTITPSSTILVQTGNTTAGNPSLSALTSNAGISAGVLISGVGIPDGTKVVSISAGPSPYTVTMSQNAYQAAMSSSITFSSAVKVTMDRSATATVTNTTLNFYSGSQVGYRIVFGRVETDIDGNTLTRLGAPSSIGIATNVAQNSTNTTITTTLPKNSDPGITFYQLYRSEQTDSIDIVPLDQYNLVAERDLTSADFTARVLTITDSTPDSLKGIPLYAGSDQEGILQANNPPPMAWDVCSFRDFMLYVNVTQPTTLKFSIVSVGAPDGVQVNDTITISGTHLGVPFTQTYTGMATENVASRQFAVVTSGTAAQNIADTAASLIRVLNYDQAMPVHAILISSSLDLAGQLLLEADNPGYETFTITASGHADAYDPTLNNVESEVNTVSNGILVSKSGEMEAVPSTNLLRAGDSSSAILRCIPLRDYVIILKSDGIYRVQGFTPNGLVVNPFDLTTKIVGPDTAVSLNSGVWMLSNQGVVSISDGGVDAKSIPIDNEFNRLIGSYLDTIKEAAFAVGYESDRKYILSLPTTADPVTDTQYVFNYVTSNWTNWNRRLSAAYINSSDGKLYIGRADGPQNGVSKERKKGNYTDFVDEGIPNVILTVINSKTVELVGTDTLEVGDILYQDASTFSPVVSIDYNLNYVTVQSALNWALGPVEVRVAFSCHVQWKQVFGDNPAFVRQFSEGLALFKNTRFNTAELNFVTDYSGSSDPVTVFGTGNGLWGLFDWGDVPWGGGTLPDNVRFLVPQNKQMGSYLIPSMTIRQGLSDFKFQGLSITYSNQSGEVGL